MWTSIEGRKSGALERAAKRGTWVAQSVKHPTSAQVMVCGFEPHVGLCADGPEPGACFRLCVCVCVCVCVCLSLSAPPQLMLYLSPALENE